MVFKIFKRFIDTFIKTYREEYSKLLSKKNQQWVERKHLQKMATDREYNDSHVLKLAKEYVKNMERNK